MGGFFGGTVLGFTLKITNRQYGPKAGAGATGNNVLMIGTGAGATTGASNVVVLGPNALGADPATDSSGTGSVVIGSGAMAAATTMNGAWIVIGQNAVASMAAAIASSDAIMIGTNVAQASLYLNRNTVLGNYTLQTHVGDSSGAPDELNVLIGDKIADSGASGVGQLVSNTVVGYAAAEWFDANTGTTSHNVVIGQGAFSPGNGLNGPGGNVFIGDDAGNGFAAGTVVSNVVIGNNACAGGGNNAYSNNVCIGATVDPFSGTSNVIIGAVAKSAGAVQCVVIGYKANSANATENSSLLIEIEDDAGATGARALIFGNFLAGNVVIGNSVAGTNRDTNGTNTLKIINGTKAGNPVGGGYFYVNAGALHWVGSAGTDTTIANA